MASSTIKRTFSLEKVNISRTTDSGGRMMLSSNYSTVIPIAFVPTNIPSNSFASWEFAIYNDNVYLSCSAPNTAITGVFYYVKL